VLALRFVTVVRVWSPGYVPTRLTGEDGADVSSISKKYDATVPRSFWIPGGNHVTNTEV